MRQPDRGQGALGWVGSGNAQGRREGSLALPRFTQGFCIPSGGGEPGQSQTGNKEADGGRAWPCVSWPQLASQLGPLSPSVAWHKEARPLLPGLLLGWTGTKWLWWAKPLPAPNFSLLAGSCFAVALSSQLPHRQTGSHRRRGCPRHSISALPDEHCDPLCLIS